MRGMLICGLTLLLAACGEGQEETGGLTPDESRQLNEAAAMLDTMPDESVVEEAETGDLPVTANAATK